MPLTTGTRLGSHEIVAAIDVWLMNLK